MIQKSQVKLQIMIHLLSQVDKCAKVVAVANVVLGMIKTTFLCEEKNLVLQLYKSLVRPKLRVFNSGLESISAKRIYNF